MDGVPLHSQGILHVHELGGVILVVAAVHGVNAVGLGTGAVPHRYAVGAEQPLPGLGVSHPPVGDDVHGHGRHGISAIGPGDDGAHSILQLGERVGAAAQRRRPLGLQDAARAELHIVHSRQQPVVHGQGRVVLMEVLAEVGPDGAVAGHEVDGAGGLVIAAGGVQHDLVAGAVQLQVE